MSTIKTIAIVTTAVAILALCIAFNEYNEVHLARAGLVAADLAQKDLAHRLTAAADMTKSLQAQVGFLQEQLAPAATHAPDQVRPPLPPAADNAAGNQPAPANNPRPLSLTAGQVQQNIQSVVQAHVPLLRALNLTPEQTGQFMNLLTAKQEAAFAAANAAMEQGADAATTSQMVADAQAQVNSQIQAQFGDAAYAQYQQYDQTFPARNTVNVLQQILSRSPTPLTDDQASQLVPLLAQTETPQSGGSLLQQINGSINAHSQISDQTISQAAATGLLSADQLQMLQLMQQSRDQGRPIVPGPDGKPMLGPSMGVR